MQTVRLNQRSHSGLPELAAPVPPGDTILPRTIATESVCRGHSGDGRSV